jgi:integrase
MSDLENVEVFDSIKAQRPKLKDNSIKMYELLLTKLQAMFSVEKGYDFLKDVDKVKEKLSAYHYTSQRNYYNAIAVLLMALNSEKEYDELIEEYLNLREELNQKYKSDNESGVISEKQQNNFVPYEDIKKMIKNMDAEIKFKKLKKKELLSIQDRELMMAWSIFNTLIRMASRNDMAGQKLITKTMYNKLSEEDKKNNNYLLKEKTGMTMIVNQYKTSAKYGEKRIEVPKDLVKIFNVYIKVMGIKAGDVLYTNSKGTPLNRNQISQLLLKYSQKYLGKNISTNMMRKIVATHEVGEQSQKMKDLADKMGHSVAVQQLVYVKKSNE